MSRRPARQVFNNVALCVATASFMTFAATYGGENKKLQNISAIMGVFSTAAAGLSGLMFKKEKNSNLRIIKEDNDRNDPWDNDDSDDNDDDGDDGDNPDKPVPVITPFFGRDEPEEQKRQIATAMRRQEVKVIRLHPEEIKIG